MFYNSYIYILFVFDIIGGTGMNENRLSRHYVLIAGALIMLCAGILYMWSVFQPHVAAYHGWQQDTAALTSSVMISCFVLGNIIAGMLQERVHPRLIACAGSVLFALGIYFTSYVASSAPIALYLSYGVVGGLGCGILNSTVLAVLQKWYASKMGFITGVAVGFFGLSVVLLSPLVEMLLNRIELTATFRALAIVFFVVLTVSSMFLKNPEKSYYYAEVTKAIKLENVRQFRPRDMLKSASYYYIIISTFASAAAYMIIVPFIYTIAVSRGMSTSLALAAVMCMGGANSLGRIGAPILSDKIGRTNTIILGSLVSLAGCLLIISAEGVLYIAAVILIALPYGGAGGVNPVIATELFGARYSGANYGLVLLSIAFSSIFFGRISAFLGADGDFTTAFMISAVLCAVPVIMMLLLRKRCKRLGKNI